MPGTGIYSVTVPGAVAGWDALRARFGALPMTDILAPAIFYAANGFPVTDIIAQGWAGSTPKLAADAQCREGVSRQRPGAEGRRAVQKSGARARRSGWSPEKGPAGFYEGATADAILATSRRLGGTMTAEDLKEFKPEWVDPISTTYRGLDRVGAAAEHRGDRGADDAEPDGAVPARAIRTAERPRAARDDRGEEARLCRHAALRRGSEVRGGAGGGDAQQRPREGAGPN